MHGMEYEYTVGSYSQVGGFVKTGTNHASECDVIGLTG